MLENNISIHAQQENEQDSKPTLLVVDDIPENIDVLVASLRDEYRIKVALNGPRALTIAKSDAKPDLILLDVMMPDMDGYEVCKRLKADPVTANIPVIFVTAKHDVQDEERGFAMGAADYIAKPISPPLVRARVRNQIALYDQNRQLMKKVRERTKELHDSKVRIIHHLGRAMEYKDNETGAHVVRMSYISKLIAEQCVDDPDWVEKVFLAAPMHDVGKIGIADAILLKPGKLAPEEWEEMKKHTLFGAEILDVEGEPLLDMARTIALTHHERWDGSGYPKGLKGDAIPLEGRIVALADVIDALLSKRPYKEAWSTEQAFAYVRDQAGQHFDPKLAQIALDLTEEIVELRSQYPDE
ncbi:Cyclic di-GMP phosphodiesterase response regulator RpfG [Marinomonas aquimarina]|uniref:Cyclic di-GMP phosphodiesterase response regulator RpfG n=1 Tax=Marinomonas aquimarina TaxID=295068 RepID=A0A1A8TA22_9GAMM|nr:HD domain-containing phosphohydrolase [Marinomonas aquimarina]SBS29662.1 Cyclic di-GMP phosphodiesterase response regulator RpfG [Marinomonas aquimarina]